MIWTIVGTGIALAGLFIGLFAWLRSDMKELAKGLDVVSRDVHQVARELSELRGEVRGRLSARDLPTALDTGIPPGRLPPRTAAPVPQP
ncbi:MAG: hypothetical protein F4Y01_12875 [Gammaproteobacteria bacterium]|nr:hypothetical protein [Gammaproteobacteria bacterium]